MIRVLGWPRHQTPRKPACPPCDGTAVHDMMSARLIKGPASQSFATLEPSIFEWADIERMGE